jgi:Thioesterase-like superfamily
MAIFEADGSPGYWKPSPLAAGPFAGLQGGAVAGLLTGEIEALAPLRGWGTAVSGAAWFLRPVPMARLRSQVIAVRDGGRVAVVDNTLWVDGEPDPCATVRITLIRDRAIEVPGFVPKGVCAIDPSAYPVRHRAAAHGRPWFLDAMETRLGDDVAWYRLKERVVEGAGPLSRTLGPADWAHGIFRPVQDVVADPNPNLTVHLVRPPRGDWIGVRSRTHWEPARGIGLGTGALLDVEGEIGAVSMAVALTPFARPDPPK